MSEKESAETIPRRVLVDADVFISYLTSDKLSVHAERLVDKADATQVRLYAASEMYDDVITALRTERVNLETVIQVLMDIRKIPHETLPTTPEIAEQAMLLYSQFGGPRRLHYFDAFHVTTAKIFELPLITSDRFVLQNSRRLGITTIDLRTLS
jgi:predicted nucleic acid-binding protein